jgi:pyruvate kinase
LSGLVDPTTEAMVDAACLATKRLDAPLVVVATASGRTGLALSNRRPTATILALTRTEQVARSLTLCWGVTPVLVPDGLPADQELPFAIDWALRRRLAQSGQHVVLVRGEMPGQVTHRAVMAGTVTES